MTSGQRGAAMRVAVTHDLPPGGAMRALADHLRSLSERGHEVEVWRGRRSEGSFHSGDEPWREHVLATPAGRPPWWSSRRIGPLRSPRPTFRAVSAAAAACAAEINAGGFDVSLTATCPVFGSPPIGRYLVGPSVLYLQEPHRWLFEANPDLPWLAPEPPRTTLARGTQPLRVLLEGLRIHRRSQRARFEVDNARAFDQVLVNSYFSRETVLRVYGRDATVCYLGIDAARFRATGADREHVVAGVGQIARHKNVDLLIDAIARMPRPRPRIEWVGTMGDTRYATELLDRARRGSVEFVLHDAVDDDVLIDVLSRARALVYTPRLEPFGLVPLEANACGLPVVAVAEGGVRETIADGINGLLVCSSPEDVAAGVQRLLLDPELADQLGRTGRTLVEERWTLAAAATRLEACLQAATRLGTDAGTQRVAVAN